MKDVLTEKLTLIAVNISTFSGYRRATREHIAALGGNLPESAAITEGSIKVFPCDGTKSLQTIRRGVYRKLQAKGIRALGSQNVFAVRTDELDEIEKELDAAKAEFSAAKAELEDQYDEIFEKHVAANVEAEVIIRSLKVEKDVAVGKFRFGTDTFRIAPFIRAGQSEEEGVEGIVRGLGRQLFEEISSEMDKLLRSEPFEKQRVGQKSLRPLRAAQSKLGKLSFLDPAVDAAIQLISDILSALPSSGYIEGQGFVTLERLVETLSDTDALVNAASRVKNGMAAIDVLFPPVVKAAQTVAQPVQQATAPVAQGVAVRPAGRPAPVSIGVTPQPSMVVQRPMPVSKPVPSARPAPIAGPALRPAASLKPNARFF
ncbi:MAG: hypothetical protein KGZ68_16805 [Dechloromonas sp.]|nr:hypothetical protein [Dechloromonas sp.]